MKQRAVETEQVDRKIALWLIGHLNLRGMTLSRSQQRSSTFGNSSAPRSPATFANRTTILLLFGLHYASAKLKGKRMKGELCMLGKVLVVTGAFGALGVAVVNMAIARGAQVGAVDFAVKSQGMDRPGGFRQGSVDLSDASQANKAVDAVAAHFGKLDVLVNIAGAFSFETITDGDPKTWQRLYAVNVLTALNASRAAIPHLLASPAARIINIGAIGALQAGSGMGAYAASKAGVHRLTEALAAELKGKVTVNAVLPSIIDTPANRAAMPNADVSKWVTPDELANVILFLASDEASAVTGALIPVSGRM
jgi:NAD(P)-dependent dehydrogenase (short-subunit alcohol dehydrogenase family)